MEQVVTLGKGAPCLVASPAIPFPLRLSAAAAKAAMMQQAQHLSHQVGLLFTRSAALWQEADCNWTIFQLKLV